MSEPVYLKAKELMLDVDPKTLDIYQLRHLHKVLSVSSVTLNSLYASEYILENPEKFVFSLLDIKCELAKRVLKSCVLCQRQCRRDRTKRFGKCGVKSSKITEAFILTNEEEAFDISPALSVWFNGCPLSCVYCYNASDEKFDVPSDEGDAYIGRLLKLLFSSKPLPKAFDWLGGDPIPNIPFILNFLNHPDMSMPIKQVLNSNMYMSEMGLDLLNGIIDIYLADLKFGNEKCAYRLCGRKDYYNTVRTNITKALEHGSEVYIRHLVLPNHFECCSKPIMDWIKTKQNVFGDKIRVNIMSQYVPEHLAFEHDDINRSLTDEEYRRVLDYWEEIDGDCVLNIMWPNRDRTDRDFWGDGIVY